MRACGMLLPVSSLPSPYGIGAFSKEAYEFVDTLKSAGQSYWQILPLGPTGHGDSPYQSFSSFAGNPYFIDLDALIREGLLKKEECLEADFGGSKRYISYDKIYLSRYPLLRKAFERWMEKNGEKKAEEIFEKALLQETKEYCFYMAVKNSFEGKSWTEWDEEIKLRRPQAVEQYRQKLKPEIMFYQFMQ